MKDLKTNKRLPQTTINIINKQIAAELSNSSLYRAAYSWCSVNGYIGAAKFFKNQYNEELGHTDKLYDFMLDYDICPVTPSVVKPDQEFANLEDVLMASLEREFETTAEYEAACTAVMKEQHHTSYMFFQEYIAIQRKEEEEFLGIKDRWELLKKAGIDGAGLLAFDEFLGDLVG
jgi:ferritin